MMVAMHASLVLIGGGGHASDVLQTIEAANAAGSRFRVLGVLADEEVDLRRFQGRNVRQIGDIDDLRSIDAAYVLSIGWPWARRAVADRIGDLGTPAPPILDPSANVGVGVELGAGSVVLGHAHVSPMVRLGPHSLLSYNATVGHDTVFGGFGSVMPNAAVSGDVVAGNEVLVGTGAAVLEGIRLGDQVRVGAGAVVIEDVADGATVVGVPARPARVENDSGH
jgi:sugar O-acyltransferase (sialic acid O-acetyltransferase NeuD family)